MGGPDFLTISIEPKKAGSAYTIAAKHSGEAASIQTDPLPPELRVNLAHLQDAILNSPGARGAESAVTTPHRPLVAVAEPQQQLRDALSGFSFRADERMVEEIGSKLFDFIFHDEVLELYKKAYHSAKAGQRPLFIKLSVAPDLAYAPWEAFWDKDNRFYLSANQYTPFSRGPANETDDFATTARPIRILGMAARVKILSGIALPAIDVDAEQVKIKKALDGLDQDKVKVSWIPSAKARDLIRAVGSGDDGKAWDIFHFIGHGGYDTERRMGYIVVQEPGGSTGVPLSSQSLTEFLIKPDRTPKLVVLNSCSGAQAPSAAKAESGDLFSSTAADLIQGGIAAVIAMQFKISDAMGIAFSDSFYTFLADGHSVQSALAYTR
ncbi:MAG: CHAT domain-containing protein, partial [Acidobacteria bacterium]|nr:CHAT domain-containing protein [Acidobacteriota bacterium]